MFDFCATLCAGGKKAASVDKNEEPSERTQDISNVNKKSEPSEQTKDVDAVPFSFSDDESYDYPNLYQEADEMLVVALLMYAITDLRTMAKKKKVELQNPERILNLPVTLETALAMIEDNLEQLKQESRDHDMTLAALQTIQTRYHQSNNKWLNPFGQRTSNCSIQPAFLTAFGDDKPDKELVYGVGVDPARKRVTVAFRGSVTPSDFITDACITFNKRSNPLKDEPGQEEQIGIHHGFDEYLLKRRKVLVGDCKYDEIMSHVKSLFEDQERKETYKLYTTGHSLVSFAKLT